MRAILIPIDPDQSIREVNINLEGDYKVLQLTSLDDNFLGVEQSVVMVAPFTSADELPDNRLVRNERATCLYAPYDSRFKNFILGDAYIVGEGVTEDGDFGLQDLDLSIGDRDIVELVERYGFR